MSLSRVGLSVLRGVRNRSSSASNVYPGYAKTGVLKDKFGIEDSTPVFKKGGTLDNVLYGATFIACAAALGFSVNAYYLFSLQ
ncbi:unnamed protein product [Nezara viridula]|uniref:Uncharacterized protein n=1 Tax=Nezara viridula TaxID=85310 RepID=A0A9P0MXC9_NEZVI|nr:unnamed protein product [Nezara viridula]